MKAPTREKDSIWDVGLFLAFEDWGHYAGVAASVHHRDNPKRFSLGCVVNQIFTNKNELQRPRGGVRGFVALFGKCV